LEGAAKPLNPNYPGYGNAGLAFLSFASGCTDVLTFLKLGNVFTSAMTGNMALLAIEIGRGQLVSASRALIALLAFALGVALATKMNTVWYERLHPMRCFRRLLFLELVFLTACAALWSASADPVGSAAGYAVIVLSAVSMGIQAVAAGSISSGINTIVFTSVLVRIVTSLTAATGRPGGGSQSLANIIPHLGTFAAYGCGALLAATLVWHFFRILIWIPIVMVIIALRFSMLPANSRETAHES
jgi:uncharacterized membrane protein YoaK (UPF0700 family)